MEKWRTGYRKMDMKLKLLQLRRPLLRGWFRIYSGHKLASDVLEWLATKGFHINGMYNTSYDHEGKIVQADFLFFANSLKTQ